MGWPEGDSSLFEQNIFLMLKGEIKTKVIFFNSSLHEVLRIILNICDLFAKVVVGPSRITAYLIKIPIFFVKSPLGITVCDVT